MLKIIFMGTPDFSVPILQQLIENNYHIEAVVTQPDRPKGRKKVLTPPPVKVEALKHNIPVLQPQKMKDEYEQVLALNPDLIITAAFGQILPKEILESPKYGCINVHASLLPELRGGAPIHYSILQGKEKTGVTIMYMVQKLDAGDILTQVEVPILETDHVGSLHDKLSEAGAKLLLKTLPLLLNNELKPRKQNEEAMTFASNITREQEKINWHNKGTQIYNQIRGLHPWPVAYTTMDGQVLKIWWGEKAYHTQHSLPGTIVKIENDGFIVATGDETALKITELQPSGKKRMSSKEYLHGIGKQLQIGMRLGVENEE